MGKAYTKRQIDSLPPWAGRLIHELIAEVNSLKDMVSSDNPRSNTFLLDRIAEKEGKGLMSLGHNPTVRFIPPKQKCMPPERFDVSLTTTGELEIWSTRPMLIEPVISNRVEVFIRP